MIIPYSVPETVRVPLLPNESIVKADLTTMSPSIILTTNTIHLYDHSNSVIIAAHQRSEEALAKYGKNLGFRLLDDLLIVHTDNDFLLLYSILNNHHDSNSSHNEILTVYSATSTMLQNGLVQDEPTGFNFFNKDSLEEPILKYQLRFKLFLKISNGIKDFIWLTKHEILLLTKNNVCLLNLSNDKNINIEFEGLGDENTKIVKAVSNNVLFVIFNDKNEARLYKRSSDTFKPFNDYKFTNVSDAAINSKNNLIILREVGEEDDKLIYYNYSTSSILKKTKLEGSIKSINWSFDNQTLMILFNNGHWSLQSTFGSTLFNSQIHSEFNNDSNWLTKINSVSINEANSKIFLTSTTSFYQLRLLSSQFSNSNSSINHNQLRPILLNDSEIHSYSGHEMINVNSTSSRTINWNIIKIPYDHYHQIQTPRISQVAISKDSKFLALSNETSLLLYSSVDNDWSFYINDYNHEMNIKALTWFEKLNLLILVNKTVVGSELIIFDFKKFNKEISFDSQYVVFKYDFNLKTENGEDDEVDFINLIGDDLIILTKKRKFYYFKFEILPKSFKIDLIKILSLEKLFSGNDNVQNLIKVNNGDVKNDDLIAQVNGELIYLKELEDKSFVKNLLFDKVEYTHKIHDNSYYLFNGEELFLITDFKKLVSDKSPESSVLSIPTDNQYPLLLILEKGLIITLENEFINKKQIQLNNIITKNSIFLHDLIKFELINSKNQYQEVFNKYHKYKNFQYSLELLLYKTITNNEDLSQISSILKIDPLIELNIISKCLRKIEVYYWNDLFKSLEITPDVLLDRAIELKQFKILGILILIFLNYDQIENQPKNIELGKDELKLINFLKLIYENSLIDEELWETALEMLRFFKILDPSGDLLKKSIDVLQGTTQKSAPANLMTTSA